MPGFRSPWVLTSGLCCIYKELEPDPPPPESELGYIELKNGDDHYGAAIKDSTIFHKIPRNRHVTVPTLVAFVTDGKPFIHSNHHRETIQ
jgi:hypothetical protein